MTFDQRDRWEQELESRGFLHPERSAYNLAKVAEALDLDDPAPLVLQVLHSYDPDLALNGLERLIDRIDAEGRAALAEATVLDRVILIAASSEHLVESCAGFLPALADPDFTDLPEGPRPFTGETTEDLRRWHRLETARICLADLEDRLDVEETALALSQLADRCAEALLDLVCDAEPLFAVIALGKWGGMELNYSSDIDFFFLRRDDSDAVACERAARRFLKTLTGAGAGGHIYRTDLRLRPGGPSAALVPTLTQARNEFQASGGTWERMIHIRAHVAAGDVGVADELLAELESFVYESPFHLEEIRQVKGYRDLLEQSVSLREDELKAGWGGIRDVEYVVQFLQLLHGAVYSSIRGGNVFRAIRVLARVGALTTTEKAYLQRGYRFLRKVEHHLMLRHRRQSLLLPEKDDSRRAIARVMGFEAWQELRDEFDQRRNTVREIFERLLNRLFTTDVDGALAEVNIILAFRPSPEEIERVFEPLHFRDPQKAYALLRRLAYPRRQSMQSPRARHFLAHLFPQLLASLRESPDPDQAVLLFTNCLETLGAPTTFYQLLAEKPENCALFVDLFGSSRFLSDLLLDHPSILDELVDRLRTGEKIQEGNLIAELRASVESTGAELRARVLHEFRAIHTLEIALLDLSGKIPLKGVLRRLSSLARAIIRVTDEIILAETAGRLGNLQELSGEAPPRHALIALGRLGGEEMGYASDIDMILVYDGAGATADGIKEREFYTQHLQHVIGTISNPGTGGTLYPVDLRLRPHGQGGALVHSFDKFRQYFTSDDSQVWEHQALVRSSPAGGDEGLCDEIMSFIREHIGRGLENETIIEETRSMHARRKEESARTTGFRLKTGPGGLLDLEYLVQSAILLGHRDEHGDWPANTQAAIHLLEKTGYFTPKETADLTTAYSFLRLVENRMSMMHRASVRVVDTDDSSLRDLALRIGYQPPAGAAPEKYLLEEIRYHTGKVRQIFRRHAGGDES